jgi:hypothetical protein
VSPLKTPAAVPAPARERDIRLDFFRGVAMIVILVAHITDNPWTLWIPGRFGFSDSTEIFVFCSGMASAIAYGAIFARAGWAMGTARVLLRIWQVYWVHIGIFMTLMLLTLLANYSHLFPRDEVGALNLYPFLRNTGPNLVGLMTLTYVPNFFDILPMYIVLLALVPPMVALARVEPRLALLVSLGLWAVGTSGGLAIPAEWWFPATPGRSWFFNPFAWQLVFFTGFGLRAGWLPVPPVHRGLVWLALGIVALALPFAWHVTIGASPALRAWRHDWVALYDKTGMGVLRYVHFLALAYLAWVACGPGGQRLKRLAATFRGPVGAVVDIGRQSLAVFAASMVLARVLGAFLELFGRGPLVTAILNLAGIALIWAVARIAGWFKSQPWKAERGHSRAAEADGRGPAGIGPGPRQEV